MRDSTGVNSAYLDGLNNHEKFLRVQLTTSKKQKEETEEVRKYLFLNWQVMNATSKWTIID